MAEASLDTPEEYMRDVYDEYVERRKFLIDGLNPVSYTHLDVYKRQAQNNEVTIPMIDVVAKPLIGRSPR